MDRVDELKGKARELERSDQPRSALELYLRLARETDSQSTGALWARIGDLQLQLGDPASARESYSRAIELFAGAGQTNNAIAIARRRIDANSEDPVAHLTMGELSLALGYRDYARAGLASFARDGAQHGRAAGVVGVFTAFLDRFPDETRLWKEWADEMLGLGRREDSIDALRQLWEHLSERGATSSAEEVRAAIVDIDPTANPLSAPGTTRVDHIPLVETAEPEPSLDSLPLLGYDLPSPASGIAPLEGLEPTHADLVWDQVAPQTAPIERLPSIERTELGSAEGLDGEEQGDQDDLPLLGMMPELREAPASVEPRGAQVASPSNEPEDEWTEDLPLIGADLTGLSPATEPRSSADTGLDSASRARKIVAERIFGATDRRAEPSHAGTHYDLGLAYKEMGLGDESLAHLAAALDEGHDPIAIIEVAGELLVERGEPEAAREILRAAASFGDPDDRSFVGIHYWLARSMEALGDTSASREHFDRVVKVDPDFRDTRSRLNSGGF